MRWHNKVEQIYTIPVNEAFSASEADKTIGCPLCALRRKLENDELTSILGASMMEPDIRIMTNKQGFCRTHYDIMLTRNNRLGMALTLESHLDEISRDIKRGFADSVGKTPRKRITELESSCYVCNRTDFKFSKMLETTILLWDSYPEFSSKFKAQPYFCLPHYKQMLECSQNKLSKKKQALFAEQCEEIVNSYLETLREDVSWFCKKFDYRYEDEPWKNSKDAIERAIKFLRSDIHTTQKDSNSK